MDSSTINKIFDLQVKNKKVIRQTSYRERINKIKSIVDWMYKNREAIKDALKKDLSKPGVEVDITEMWVAVNFAKDVIKNLRRWMIPKKVPSSLAVLFSKSYIEYYPKGVCLIISPWNYPFQLCVVPLIYSIAAGNCCIIKPSELTPNTSKLVHQMVKDLFNEGEVAVIEGNAKEASLLLEMPFNHIFFTGSDSIGKKVVEASSRHLSSVTLELGGKSPVVVDKGYSLSSVVDKVVTAKFINLGQSCIAPDYIAVQDDDFEGFVEMLIKKIKFTYGNNFDQQKNSKSLARIVNEKHFNRLVDMIDDKGCKILYGGGYDKKDLFISPTIVDMRGNKTQISNQEIFGPVIPVISYSSDSDLDSILDKVGDPLALYVFSKSKKFISRIKSSTSSGAVCVNDIAVHFLNQHLPFGGVMGSGRGRYHGFSGFKEFSNSRSIIIQSKINFLGMIGPPYSKTVKKIVDTLIYLYKKI